MNKKIQYQQMLEMPTQTVSITHRKKKSRFNLFNKKVDAEKVKKQLIEKVNQDEGQEIQATQENFIEDNNGTELIESQATSENQIDVSEVDIVGTTETDRDSVSIRPVKNKKRTFKIPVVTLQLVVIGALMLTIFLTSALNTNSGINVFFRNVFGSSQTVDSRIYTDFKPQLFEDSDFLIDDGVVSFTDGGSVYVWCDGVITDVVNEGETYTIEVTHNQNFKSVIKNLTYLYSKVGDNVKTNIPVGYCAKEGQQMCFLGQDGSVITDYQIIDNSVVWAV